MATNELARKGTEPRRALIVGGSLAGLFTGIALRNAGWDVEVFERSPHTLTGRGGGIVLQPHVVDILRLADTADLAPLGVEAQERVYVERDGSVSERAQTRQILTSWSLLYKRARQAIPDEQYHLGARMVGFEEAGDSVTATFADGRRTTGDLLIGADGVNSTVRRLNLADCEPVYAGYVAWRGVVPEVDFVGAAADFLRDRFVFNHIPNSHILQYVIPSPEGNLEPGQRSFNWVWYRNVPPPALAEVLTDREGRARRASVPPGLARPEAVADLHRAAAELLAPQMAELVQATPDPFIQTILDLTVPQMVFGRVVLLGDAAFVVRPHTAASTAKAASNAMALAEAVSKPQAQGSEEGLQAALATWEANQLHLGKALHRQGRSLGKRAQFPERFYP
jgi:2-polyprenyl-6-methoxyphenol hydroxylase-like FAD-dependent oxidoreductase